MRGVWLAIWLIVGVCGIPVFAQAHVTNGPAQVKALLAEFPNGGPGLRAAIARAVELDPALADDVVSVAAQASAAQQQAMGQGLADSATFFEDAGTNSGHAAAAKIEAAIQSGPPGLLGGFARAGGPNIGPEVPGVDGPTLTTNNCVSQSSPSSCR